jgi:3-hydroxyacyl-[acyl-carrier-protein] dehydratase
MEAELQEIYARLPHRPPFLWVDRIVDLKENSITTEKYIAPDLELFKGHYPGYPLMPGVLICEAVFQAGAILMADTQARSNRDDTAPALNNIPVLTRIYNAKFKRQVLPGDTIHISVVVNEILGPAWLLKGTVLVNNKVALKVEFGCPFTARNR